MKFKNKLLYILIFFAVIFTIPNITNAALEETGETFSVTYNDTVYQVPYVKDSNYSYHFYVLLGDPSKPYVCYYMSNYSFTVGNVIDDCYGIGFGNIVYSSNYKLTTEGSSWSEPARNYVGYLDFYYMNSDGEIYNDTGNVLLYAENTPDLVGYGIEPKYTTLEDFLLVTPPVEETVLGAVAKTTLEEQTIQKTLLEVLILVIPTIVGLIGFWKACSFLSKQLRGS